MTRKQMLSLLLCLTLLFCCVTSLNASAAENNVELSTDDFLLLTGMTLTEVDAFDPDFKEYIVENLKQNEAAEDLEFIKTEDVPVAEPLVNQVLTGIKFYVSSWKSGSTIYIYPTYEFTTAKRPRGQDSFAFQLGDAMRPYTYGGKMWWKNNSGDSWQSSASDTMTANTQSMNGAEYSGSQLGSPTYSMYIKGAAYCYADAGTGTDKRIIMSYMHNPNQGNYSISFSAYGVGISYSSTNTIYTAASTVNLTY